jgi:hypothetical protein
MKVSNEKFIKRFDAFIRVKFGERPGTSLRAAAHYDVTQQYISNIKRGKCTANDAILTDMGLKKSIKKVRLVTYETIEG